MRAITALGWVECPRLFALQSAEDNPANPSCCCRIALAPALPFSLFFKINRRWLLPSRLHIGELEARNRAMISELDTARMELDNKIREKRELMQAHAAYVEEMERQHALRVDELDTLVQQYRATIWQYEAKVEGLEKELEGQKKSSAPRAMPDVSQFEATGEEDADELRSKNAQLLAEYEAVVGDLAQAESQRDASKREVSRTVVH